MGYVCLFVQSYNALHKAHQLVSLYFWIPAYGLKSINCPCTKVTRWSTNTERTFEQIWRVSSTRLLFRSQTITWNSLILKPCVYRNLLFTETICSQLLFPRGLPLASLCGPLLPSTRSWLVLSLCKITLQYLKQNKGK